MDYIPRLLAPRLQAALEDTPVVLVNGPRQAGKTTLIRQYEQPNRPYFTLDDAATLSAAVADPVGLIRTADQLILDEVQRAPGLFLAIKSEVDRHRLPGRFLLTGSADVLNLPGVLDSLAGRIESIPLLPLSAGELSGTSENFPDRLFENGPDSFSSQVPADQTGRDLVFRIVSGGFPPALSRKDLNRRQQWLSQYLQTLMTRDVSDLVSATKADRFPRLLQAMAAMSGQLVNVSGIAGEIGLDHKTADRYLTVLENLFLLKRVPQWSVNALSRVVKSPKIQFTDSGVLCAVLGLSTDLMIAKRQYLGSVLESWVYSELAKQCSWSDGRFSIWSFRTVTQQEVDFVLEDSLGRIWGLEVKAAAAVSPADRIGLKKLAELAGDRFQGGVIFYDGTHRLPMGSVSGKAIWAMPFAMMWEG